MILFSQFGYAFRHNLQYDPKSKPGNLRLWSSSYGSGPGPDPTKKGDSAWSEFWALQERRSPPGGANVYVDFSIGNDDDVFSVLIAAVMIKAGNAYSFKNFAGRRIFFSRSKEDNKSHDIIRVEIQHKTDTGILTLPEIDELETVTRSILVKIGYSNQDIAEKVKYMIGQSSIQEGKNT